VAFREEKSQVFAAIQQYAAASSLPQDGSMQRPPKGWEKHLAWGGNRRTCHVARRWQDRWRCGL